MGKFQNRYRIESARLQNWDYGWNAAYFITICTKNCACYFGNMVETQAVETQAVETQAVETQAVETQDFASLQQQTNLILQYKMELSPIGKKAKKYWYEIPQHFPFVKLGEFIVMPNHVHGIVIIDKTDDGRNDNVKTNNVGMQAVETQAVETQDFASLPQSSSSKNKFGPQSKNLASIIRGYKIGVTKHANCLQLNFAWQPRFYDHIIRTEKSYLQISEYIINNPAKWGNDKLNLIKGG